MYIASLSFLPVVDPLQILTLLLIVSCEMYDPVFRNPYYAVQG